MRKGKVLLLTGLLVTILVLGACSPSNEATPTLDEALIHTQAAQTVAAQFTQTSAAATAAAPLPTDTLAPTPTTAATFTPITNLSLATLPPNGQPFPTSTLSLLPLQGSPTGALCDNSAYLQDIGTPDNTVLKPGQAFAKGWLIQNTGTCKWGLGYHLVRIGGNTDFGGGTYFIRSANDIVQPGEVAEVSLNLVAPKKPGTYEARYQLYNDRDVPFGTGMTVSIQVEK